jgi:hypothetical protein
MSSKQLNQSKSTASTTAAATVIAPAPATKLAFPRFNSTILMSFFSTTEEARIAIQADAARSYIIKQLRQVPGDSPDSAHLHVLLSLAECEISAQSYSNPALYAKIVLKGNEIMRTVSSHLISMELKICAAEFDSVTLDRVISDEELFALNKQIDAAYDMIMVRDEAKNAASTCP